MLMYLYHYIYCYLTCHTTITITIYDIHNSYVCSIFSFVPLEKTWGGCYEVSKPTCAHASSPHYSFIFLCRVLIGTAHAREQQSLCYNPYRYSARLFVLRKFSIISNTNERKYKPQVSLFSQKLTF